MAVLFIVIIFYLKNPFLYHPHAAFDEKYDRFYQKIYQLAESEDHVSNFFVRTSDNIMLDTLYLKNSDTDICIIFFHGNAGNLAMRYDMIKFLYNFGSVIIFDYRSFGRSNGDIMSLSESSLLIDASTIWTHVTTDLKYQPNRTALFGESLGCSIALSLAAKLSKTLDSAQYPHSLILNSPFYSLSSIMRAMFSKLKIGFVGNFLSVIHGYEYRSDIHIQYINHLTKIVIAHSPRDEIVPYKEGQNLYKLAALTHPDTKFVNILGTHNNLCLTDSYIYALSDLFQ